MVGPQVILIDRELGLIKAIEFVFPSSSYLLCTWHINKDVAANTKLFFSRNEDFNRFLSKWNAVMVATSEGVFNSRFTNLVTEYACINGLLDYLMST
ncbi:hypothetical protein Scep_014703 [Stephania cephalantha]|uniref:MULE transposase domain-containing protein n=1 Tax=Stephania cephalantha TaxID=152367 RepID=A0AAP0NZN5_9MAGN